MFAIVRAPLPFISAMAGFHLAFEFFKSRVPGIFGRWQDFNYAQVNPFFPPNPGPISTRTIRLLVVETAAANSGWLPQDAWTWISQSING